MADSARLQILIDIISRLEGLDTAVAKATELNAMGEASVATALQEAKAQEGVATQLERQIILATQLEAAEAKIAGDNTLAAKLEREASIRQRALGIQQINNATSEQAIAIAERLALAQETGAAAQAEGSLLASVNLTKARNEATTLARELAAGGVNGRTLGALLGSLGPTLTIAGLAAYELYSIIAHAGDEILETEKEIEKQTDGVVKQVGHWNELARAAGNFGDVVKLGSDAVPHLEVLSKKADEIRNKEIGEWQKFYLAVATLFADETNEEALSNKSQYDRIRDERAQRLDALVRQNLQAANSAITRGQTEVAAWEAEKAAIPSQAIADYTKKIEDLKAQQAGVNRSGSVGEFNQWQDYQDQILLAQKRLDELTKTQDRFAADTEKVAAAIRKADFAQLDPEHQLVSLNTELVGIQEKLKDVGVEAATPNDALAQAANLTRDDQAEVIKLAGAWAQVINAINGAISAQQNLEVQSTAAIKDIQDRTKLLNDQASGDKGAVAADRGKRAYDDALKSLLAKHVPEEEAKKSAQDYADATERAARAANAIGAAKSSERAAHQDIAVYMRQQESALQNIRQQQQLIAQSQFLSLDEKQARLLALDRDEIAAMNQEIARGKALIAGGTLDPATYEQVTQKIQQARFEVELLSQKTQTLSFGGGLRAEITQWANSFGTAAHQVGQAITGSINTALDATGQLLTDAIFRTGNWKQTVLQAEKAIVGSLIKIGLQMLAQKFISTFITKQTTQEQTQAGAQIAAANAPAAAATSVASYGSSAIIGAIAAAAAIAAIVALLVGFEGGGHTGYGGTKQIAGVVHGQEFVHPKTTVDYYGASVMQALLLRKIPAAQIQSLLGSYRYEVTPRLGSFDAGGAVASVSQSLGAREESAGGIRGGKIGDVKAIVVNDVAALRRQIFNSDEATLFVIDAVNGNTHLIRKDT